MAQQKTQYQKTQQQITQEYLQNHQIIYSLEKALNLAIDHYISAPENFIADFLMKQKLEENPYIHLLCIKRVACNLLFVVDFLGTIRHFTFPSFDGSPSAQFPTPVYPELDGLNLLLPTAQLYAKCGSHHIFKPLLDILAFLLRETKIEQLARLINQPRQQFAIPRLVAPAVEVLGKATIGVVMRRDAISFVKNAVYSGIRGPRLPFSVQQNDKTLDMACEMQLPFEAGDGTIQSYTQFLEALRIQQNTIQDTVCEPPEKSDKADKKDPKKDAKAAKAFSQKLSFPQQLLACFYAFARVFNQKGVCKIFLKITRECIAEMQFSEQTRQFENLLLSVFMASQNDIILMLTDLANLPTEPAEVQAVRSSSAKKQPAKAQALPPKDAQEKLFSYDFANAYLDIKSAINHYNQLTSYDPEKQLKITIFSDCADVENSIPFKYHEVNAICHQTEPAQFYEKLCEMSQLDKKEDIVRFCVSTSGEKPASYSDAKRPKAQKAETPQNVKVLCNKSLTALLEEVEYQVVDNESEMYEFLSEIEGLIDEKRGFYM